MLGLRTDDAKVDDNSFLMTKKDLWYERIARHKYIQQPSCLKFISDDLASSSMFEVHTNMEPERNLRLQCIIVHHSAAKLKYRWLHILSDHHQ
jgi:hypothetical protein